MVTVRGEEFAARRTSLGPQTAQDGFILLLTCDEKFAFYTRVTLLSIFLNAVSRSFETVILASDLPADEVKEFGRLADRFHRPITILEISAAASPDLGSYFHIPRIAHLRFVAPHVIDAEVIAYIDSDCIVQVDLGDIFGEHRPEQALGGVEDPFGVKAVRYLGAEACRPYVNSGVLLFSPERWRECRAAERCVKYFALNEKKLVMKQQDALNAALPDEKYAISPKWNITVQSHRPEDDGKTDIDIAGRGGVVHFSGYTKPWSEWSHPAIRNYYLAFASSLGLPPSYWQRAETHKQFYWKARMAELEKDYFGAAVGYRRLLWDVIQTGRLDMAGFRVPEGFRLRS